MTLRVVFAGMDGTGKSTQAAEVERRLRERGLAVERIHQFAGVGRRSGGVAAAVARRVGGSQSVRDDEARRLGVLGRVTRSALATASLAAGWLRAWRADLRGRRADVLLLDRSYVDELVRVQWRLRALPRLGFWLLRTLPAPDRAFRLTVAPEVGVARKKDGSLTLAQYRAKLAVVDRVLGQLPPRWKFEEVAVDGRDVASVSQLLVDRIVAEREIHRQPGLEPARPPCG